MTTKFVVIQIGHPGPLCSVGHRLKPRHSRLSTLEWHWPGGAASASVSQGAVAATCGRPLPSRVPALGRSLAHLYSLSCQLHLAHPPPLPLCDSASALHPAASSCTHRNNASISPRRNNQPTASRLFLHICDRLPAATVLCLRRRASEYSPAQSQDFTRTSLSTPGALAMLLPSAFACEGAVTQESKRPQRPKLPSFTPYQAQLLIQPRPSPIASSCRALHAILGGPSSTQPPITAPRHELGNPFMPSNRPVQPRRLPLPSPQRGINKRRRSQFEEDLLPSESIDITMQDSQRTPRQVRTPKRRRRIPLSMPLGLSAEDFRALERPAEDADVELDMPIISPHSIPSDQDSAYGASPTLEEVEWTIEDDQALVETVLEKLRLSKREWNDCARQIGKDKDSLGRRWSLLVSEGNVGLRRGGRMSRTNLDIASW